MKFLFDSDTWQEIYGSIRKNKVRTGITIIGVLWGIFLLVVLLGDARGLENSFNKAFGNFATNSVFVWTQSTDTPFKGFQKGTLYLQKVNDGGFTTLELLLHKSAFLKNNGKKVTTLGAMAKMYASESCVKIANDAVQIHGGMGFIEETGVAQHYRDARITTIYEGTNGIQSLDLVGRKLGQDGGKAIMAFFEMVKSFIKENEGNVFRTHKPTFGCCMVENQFSWSRL